MTFSRGLVVVAMMAALGTQILYPAEHSDTPDPKQVTFNKEVLPILQKNCQTCHRPGEVAPMSFLTYDAVRPWAKSIKTAVLNKQMPPWLADSKYGKFRNAPSITDREIETLVAWVDGGAREGDPKDKPAPIEWSDGWRIQPDVVVSMPQPFLVRATGEGEVREFQVPNPFTTDTWVTSIEVRPGNASVVHHVIVQVVDTAHENAQVAALGPAVRSVAARAAAQSRSFVQGDIRGGYFDLSSAHGLLSKVHELRTGQGSFMTMETVYAPGTSPVDFRYTDSAKLIRAGGQIRLQVHYTPNGKETYDQTKVGFTKAKGPAKRSFVLIAPEHLVDPRKPIPAGAADYETTGEITFTRDAELAWFMPHMHLRGKDMTFQLFHPDGREETVLSARFNFNWQLGYEVEKPIKVTKGTRMLVTAHHDNSANNRFNPNATENVLWGDLTGQEMMLPWFGVVVDGNAAPEEIASYRPRDLVVDDVLKALDNALHSSSPVPAVFDGKF